MSLNALNVMGLLNVDTEDLREYVEKPAFERKKMRAYCSSYPCARNAEGYKKPKPGVVYPRSNCPDCGFSLYWKSESESKEA